MSTLDEYQEDLRWQELFREQLILGDAQGNSLTLNSQDRYGCIIPSFWFIPHERLQSLVQRLAADYQESPDKLKRFLRTSPSRADFDNFASGLASTVLDYVTGDHKFMLESYCGGLGAVVENLSARRIPGGSFIQSRIANSFTFCDIGAGALVGSEVVDSFVGVQLRPHSGLQFQGLNARGFSFFGADFSRVSFYDNGPSCSRFFDVSGFGARFSGRGALFNDSSGAYATGTYHGGTNGDGNGKLDYVNRMPRNVLVQCLLRGFSILQAMCPENNPIDEAIKHTPMAFRYRAESSLSNIAVACDLLAERGLTIYNADAEALVCRAIAPFDAEFNCEHPLLPMLKVLNNVYVAERRLKRGILS